MTGSKRVDLSLAVVMLFLAFDCGNCNTQQIQEINSIQSNDVNLIGNAQSVVSRDSRAVHRIRRSLLTDAEMKEVLDVHNRVRRLEGSSDMEKMTWNNTLANIANNWSIGCLWDHSRYPNLGENLYAINMTFTINLTAAILAWYNEKPNYNYDTLVCKAEPCGHYTQVVWATSRELGCAYERCPTLRPNMTNATYLVCNYSPPGNVVGAKPFKMGLACSNCASKSWWCNEGLCDGSCVAAGPTCGCAPVCLNYGSVNSATCSCSCARGWYGSDCSAVCKDNNPNCNPQPGQYGWPPEYCDRSDYGPAVREYCPAMCKQCQALNTNYSTSTKPSLLSMLAVSLSWLLLYSFRSM